MSGIETCNAGKDPEFADKTARETTCLLAALDTDERAAFIRDFAGMVRHITTPPPLGA
ncbi:hypothetical protein [Nocardia sp. NBC_01009]|uniref:hypothetical protein n=1 Tax=Nocardia sp. NBC_01009 TaxID=2975996 RepID=UPI003863B74E|nr:hypothetical protein OHA42_02425 [Nocardia sp. NBC_01009]